MNKSTTSTPVIVESSAQRPEALSDELLARPPQIVLHRTPRVTEFLLLCLFTLLLSETLVNVGQLIAALWVLSGLVLLVLVRTLYMPQTALLSGAVTLMIGLRLSLLALEASSLSGLQASIVAAVLTVGATLSLARSAGSSVFGKTFRRPLVQVLVALSAVPAAYLAQFFTDLSVSSTFVAPVGVSVVVVFGMGVVEELFYRGVLQTLIVRAAEPVVGVVLAALFSVSLFASLALWPIGLSLLCVALLSGWLRWSTGALYGAVMARALFYATLLLAAVGLF